MGTHINLNLLDIFIDRRCDVTLTRHKNKFGRDGYIFRGAKIN